MHSDMLAADGTLRDGQAAQDLSATSTDGLLRLARPKDGCEDCVERDRNEHGEGGFHQRSGILNDFTSLQRFERQLRRGRAHVGRSPLAVRRRRIFIEQIAAPVEARKRPEEEQGCDQCRETRNHIGNVRCIRWPPRIPDSEDVPAPRGCSRIDGIGSTDREDQAARADA